MRYLLHRILKYFRDSNDDKFFICANCGLRKPVTDMVFCIDPLLCATCVDAYNHDEYILTFGDKHRNSQ